MAGKINITDQQKAILESSDEIKRVIACAGSGKTLVITNNIIDILKKDLCRPDEILAVTFTRNAAENMRVKIKGSIKKKLDFESIDIYTFNSFGNNIIRENSFEVGLGKDYKLINISQSWQIIYRIISSYSFENIKIGKNLGVFINELLRYILDLKKNLISTDDLKNYINDHEAALGSYKSKALRGEEKKIALYQKELFNIYCRYEEIKRNSNLIDYCDQIFLSYNLLSNNRKVREKYKNKYKYIFVDEFQDTDIAQGYLISLLYNSGKNKVMIVGDDDQGIYSFRGACIENILKFHNWNAFEEKTVSDFYLTTNFRSGNNIITVIDNIISSNKNRFVKDLKPEYREKQSEVLFFTKKTHQDEAREIVKNIIRLINMGIKLKDIAILARRKRFRAIVSELDENGIKCEVISSKGFFFEPEIMFIISWLIIINNIYEEKYILYLLQSPKYKISDRDIYFLKNITGTSNIKTKGTDNSIIEGLLNLKQNTYISNSSKEKLENFVSDLNYFICQSQYLKLKELISLIYEHSGMSLELKSGFDTASKEKIKNIETLLKVSEEFESDTIDNNLDGFIIYLKDVAKTDYEDPERTELSNTNSIKLMSIHAAKGLEFEVVFLPMLWKSDFLGGKSSGSKFKIPSILRKDGQIWKDKPDYTSKQKFLESVKKIKIEEERRIFYVACSRAKKLLILSYSSYEDKRDVNSNKIKEKEILPFFKDIVVNKGSNLKVVNKEGLEFVDTNKGRPIKSINSKRRVQFYKKLKYAERKTGSILKNLHSRQINGNSILKVFKSLNPELKIKKDLKDFNLSSYVTKNKIVDTGGNDNIGNFFSLTGLIAYIKCPALYRWKYIYKIPELQSERVILGEKVHSYIENITFLKYRKIIEGSFLSSGNNISKNSKNESARNFIGKEIYKKIDDEQARKYIQTFLSSNIFKLNDMKSMLLEQLFYWKINSYYILCKVDRMDMARDGKIRIIDYKLSEYLPGKKDISYKSQLKSYIAGVSKVYSKAISNIYGYLFYMGNNKEIKFCFKPGEIKEFETTILDTIENIKKNNFRSNLNSTCKKNCTYYKLCKHFNF
jgi:DNA helicase-2/ATP-dependent DNA helicase PcrA